MYVKVVCHFYYALSNKKDFHFTCRFVDQGSVCSPFLFLSVLEALPKDLRSEWAQDLLYADYKTWAVLCIRSEVSDVKCPCKNVHVWSMQNVFVKMVQLGCHLYAISKIIW